MEVPDRANWTGNTAFGVSLSLASKEDYKIPPESFAQPIILHVDFLRPFDSDLRVQILVGCDGSAPSRDQWVNSHESIAEAFEAVRKGELTDHAAAQTLLGMPSEKSNEGVRAGSR